MTLPRSGFLAGGGSSGSSSGDVTAAANIPDNEIVRGDGGAKGVQGSGITIADGAAGTLSGTNSGDVTLAGTPDYITIAGQAITRAKLDPADDLNTFASSVLATLLTDETGTDKVVFNTDPVFASTITVPNVGLHVLDTNASHDLIIKPGSDLTADHTLTVTTGDSDRTLTLTGDATISGTNTGDSGDVVGPASATDNAVARFDLTTGKLIQESSVFVTDGTSPIVGLGGTTNTFPAVARHATVTNAVASVLADYSGYATHRADEFGIRADSLPRLANDGLSLAQADWVIWYATTYAGVINQRISSPTAGRFLFSKGVTTDPATTNSAVLVEANTAVAASPNILTAAESLTVLTNEGTTAVNYHTLPTAVAGYVFDFVVQDADGLRVTCAAGDTLRILGAVSAAAGYAESTTIGDTLRVVSINATEWIGYAQGTWTVV